MKIIEQTNSKNHNETKNFILFVKKSLNINMLQIKIIVKLETIVIIQGNKEVLQIAYLN